MPEKKTCSPLPDELCAGAVTFHEFVADSSMIVIVHHRHPHALPAPGSMSYGCVEENCILSFLVVSRAGLLEQLTMAPPTSAVN